MYPYRFFTLLSLLVLAGAGRAAAQESASLTDTLRVASGPEAALQERWRAPFAVQSAGEVAPRGPRLAVVRLEADTSRRQAARAASAEAPADSARSAETPKKDTVRAAAGARRDNASTPRTGSARTHRVAAGETFYAVARRYSVAPAALRAANPGVSPDGLRTGTVLRIPGSASATTASTTVRTPTSSSSAARARARTHTVVRGDTLFGIARKYGVRPAQIRTANKLKTDTVEIGQTLVIPAS